MTSPGSGENLPWLCTAANAAGLSTRLDSVVSAAAAGRVDGITELLRRMGVPEVPTLRAPGDIIYPLRPSPDSRRLQAAGGVATGSVRVTV